MARGKPTKLTSEKVIRPRTAGQPGRGFPAMVMTIPSELWQALGDGEVIRSYLFEAELSEDGILFRPIANISEIEWTERVRTALQEP